MMTKIMGADFGSLSFRRKDKVLSLSAVNTSITIDESPVPIDPLLLFQRICITKNSETDLKKFLAYELAPFPLSLITEEGMRKGTKSLLYNAFEPLTENFQPGDRHHHIIDGGFLLHKVVWGRVETFGLICKKYVAYVQQHFGETVTIVFDGCPADMRLAGTKTSERARRSRKNQSPEFTFNETTTPKISQEKFLARDQNKNNLIQMLRRYFANTGMKVEQAFEDADTLIVTTAIKEASVEILFNDDHDDDDDYNFSTVTTSFPAIEEVSRLEESTEEELEQPGPSERRKTCEKNYHL
ncbi:hypothetical protein JTB14_027100 [Gonioctena quinquepunctata]|nr:hypothetical protein JTB14_027100 [Gonioctena quinquepunctata]